MNENTTQGRKLTREDIQQEFYNFSGKKTTKYCEAWYIRFLEDKIIAAQEKQEEREPDGYITEMYNFKRPSEINEFKKYYPESKLKPVWFIPPPPVTEVSDEDNISVKDLILNVLQQVEIGTSNSGNKCIKDIDEVVRDIYSIFKNNL